VLHHPKPDPAAVAKAAEARLVTVAAVGSVPHPHHVPAAAAHLLIAAMACTSFVSSSSNVDEAVSNMDETIADAEAQADAAFADADQTMADAQAQADAALANAKTNSTSTSTTSINGNAIATTNGDGSSTTIKDGTITTVAADGTITTVENGKVTTTTPDGVTTTVGGTTSGASYSVAIATIVPLFTLAAATLGGSIM